MVPAGDRQVGLRGGDLVASLGLHTGRSCEGHFAMGGLVVTAIDKLGWLQQVPERH